MHEHEHQHDDDDDDNDDNGYDGDDDDDDGQMLEHNPPVLNICIITSDKYKEQFGQIQLSIGTNKICASPNYG